MALQAERPKFTIKVAESKDEREACMDLRVEVFIVEQGFSMDDEIDEYEATSTHFLLSVETPSPPATAISSLVSSSHGAPASKPVGTVRLTPLIGKVSRLVVLSDYRKYGFGRELMQAVVEHVKTLSKEEVKDAKTPEGVKLRLHSQIPVISFYKKMGYTPEGEQFEEDGAPHQRMVRVVPMQ